MIITLSLLLHNPTSKQINFIIYTVTGLIAEVFHIMDGKYDHFVFQELISEAHIQSCNYL